MFKIEIFSTEFVATIKKEQSLISNSLIHQALLLTYFLSKLSMIYTTPTAFLSIKEKDSTYFIQISSQFTAAEASNIIHHLDEIYCNDSTVKKIFIDFGKTTFMDNSGLFALCQIVKSFKSKEIDLSFWRFSPEVKMILSLVGLDDIIMSELI